MPDIDDDQKLDDQDLDGQPGQSEDGNDQDDNGNQGGQKATDFIEFEGVKVPADVFEKHARERFKDAFEDHENKSKWQAENTRRSMEIKQLERDAEAFRRLQSDPNYGRSRPDNSYDGQKRTYVEKKKSTFPEVDPRFFESQFDDIWEMSGRRAGETIDPIRQQQAKDWEINFLSAHPLVKTDTDQYDRLAKLIGKGYDPEDAHAIVYAKEIKDKEFQDRLKARDDEARRKLKQNRTQSSSAGTKSRNPDESFDKAWAKFGDG